MTVSPPPNLLCFNTRPLNVVPAGDGTFDIDDSGLLDDLKFLNELARECGISREVTVLDCSGFPSSMPAFGHIRVDPVCLGKVHRKAAQLGLLRDGVVDLRLRQLTQPESPAPKPILTDLLPRRALSTQ